MRRSSLTFVLLLAGACAAPEAPPPAAPPPPPPPVAPAPVASAPPPIRITPDAPFRQAAPDGGPAVVFVQPKIVEFQLKNGLRVLLAERHDLPIVSVRVVATSGVGDMPWEPPGAATFAGSMLEQGTPTRTALQISDAFEALGASHGTWIDWDSGGAEVKVLRDKLDAALPILADVVLHPSFPAEEITRLQTRRLSAIQQEKSNPTSMGSNATVAALYGRAHPYGHAIGGQTADIQKLSRSDLVRAHAVLFNPAHCAIVVAGDITRPEVLAKMGAVFGDWKTPVAPPLSNHTIPRLATPSAPSAQAGHRFVVVDKPGAPQSVVRFAEVGVSRAAPDRDAVAVMNAMFGGMFSSRINLNLREAHAYTYGAHSRFDQRHGAGPFIASASVKADTTAASITELFKEVHGIQDDLASKEELQGAKESLELALPGRFESVDAVTQALADLVVYHLPLDEYATLPARIEKVTAEEVRKAARTHLHPKTLHVVVVGDRAKLEPSFEPLHLGPIEARDAYGDLLTAKP